MARRPRLFSPGLLYHVIVRGNQRQKTFLTEQDYKAYLERLSKYRKKFRVTVYAYCLMPNHVHLLLESSSDPLARFMQGVQQSYTQYFNRVHRKTGHLFQGRYKAIVCERDEYLLTLIRYIHLNPVRASLVRRPEHYKWSGHRGYLNLDGKGAEVLDPSGVLGLFGGRGGYRRFVLDGLEEGHKEEYYEVEDQRFLGPEGFGEKMRKEVEGEKGHRAKASLGDVLSRLAHRANIDVGILRSPDRGRRVSKVRTLLAYVLVRRMGFSVSEVATYMGRDPTTLSVLISRLTDRMQSGQQIKKETDKFIDIVNI